MKILFVLWHPLYVLRLYEAALRRLAAAGHAIHLGFTKTTPEHVKSEVGEFLDGFTAEFPRVTYGTLPDRDDMWLPMLHEVRSARNFLTYQHARFRNSHKLQERAGEEMWPFFRWVAGLPFIRGAAARPFWYGLLRTIEEAVPSDRITEQVIASYQPDLVFITPLVHAPARQNDYVKSARRLGLPTVVGVASWDNLTTKGVIQMPSDAVLVWNDAQKREAEEIHGIPASCVVATGAQSYDHWFDQQPSQPREGFCAHVGLDPNKPILLYLCSSRFLQDDERVFIRKWVGEIRNSPHPQFRDAGVLIRPYPTTNVKVFEDFDLSEFGNAVVWPKAGQHPLTREAKEVYFDSIYHSAAVVGANTSGLIEAGIVGRRCFSLMAPEFSEKQNGMPHFSYIRDSGFLMTATTFEEHLGQLQRELQGQGESWDRVKAFLSSFIRPHGLDQPAAPFVVQALERIAQTNRRQPVSTPLGLLLVRWWLWPWMAVRQLVSTLVGPVVPPLKPTKKPAAPVPPAKKAA